MMHEIEGSLAITAGFVIFGIGSLFTACSLIIAAVKRIF